MRNLLLLLVAAPLAAQQTPAVRLINAPDAASKPVLNSAVAARQLPNGSVVVNDVLKRQLVMFDNALGTTKIIADSVSGGASSYGPTAGALTGFSGDSLLFIDPRDLSMFVIDPMGAIARVAAVPRSQDALFMGSNVVGTPTLDPKGRLVYRGNVNATVQRTAGAPLTMPSIPDSATILRVDLGTRKLDTLAYFKIPKNKMTMTQLDGGFKMVREVDPMPIVDDFATLSDGSVAIVRGRDYHIDWVSPDGKITSSPKISFDWQRLSDEQKVAVVDSAKAAEKARANAAANPNAAAAAAAGGVAPATSGMSMSFGVNGDGVARSTSVGAGPALQTEFINPSELADYRPAFLQGAAKADPDGNLWVRTSAVRQGGVAAGPIYDVINRQGGVVDRVQVPAGRQIIGFARNGVVYMSARDDRGTWIERTTRSTGVRP